MSIKDKLKELKKKSVSKKRKEEIVRSIRKDRKSLSSNDKSLLEDIGLYSIIFSGHDSVFDSLIEDFDVNSDLDFSGFNGDGGDFSGAGSSTDWSSDSSSDSSSSYDSSSDSSSSFDSGGFGD